VNARSQRWCAWAGPAFLVSWGIGFCLLAGFIPPPTPNDTPAELLRMFQADPGRIRLGLVISMFGSVLLLPWGAVLTVQMKRIEGRSAPLAYTQLAAAAAGAVFLTFPVMYLQIASFRLDRSPELIQLMNDMFWVPFIGVPALVNLQTLAIGLAILQDRRERPVYPRWAGYLNVWACIVILPAGVMVFFKDGPFAWNGLFAWWLPLAAFVIWFAVMLRMLLNAVAQEEPEPEPVSRADHDALVAQVAALRTQVGGVTEPA
jgi:hypothetical protein